MDNENKPYIRCEMNDSNVKVKMDGNGEDLVMMACTILCDISNAFGIDLKEFVEIVSKNTFDIAKIIKMSNEEEKNNENHII